MLEPADDLPFSADISAECLRWLAFLGNEKRMSPKTVEAYRRDVTQFLLFMADHLGGQPSLADFAALSPQDVRAFMAGRRAKGIGGRTLMRQLAGARSFARFLEHNGKGKVGALNAVRAPKIPKSLPKPLAVRQAKRDHAQGQSAREAGPHDPERTLQASVKRIFRDVAVVREQRHLLDRAHRDRLVQLRAEIDAILDDAPRPS